MKTLITTILFLAAATPALADATRCSNADQSLSFIEDNYDGGAPPRPTQLVHEATWKVMGQIVGHATTNGAGQSVAMPIGVSWNEASKTSLSHSDDGQRIYDTYSIRVTLTGVNGNGTATSLVICDHVQPKFPLP